MKINAWVRIPESLAQTWRDWAMWHEGGREGPEPALHDFAKTILTDHVIDWPFSFNAFHLATFDMEEWRMGSIYSVTEAQLQEGYTVYPGQWEVVGVWGWTPGDVESARVNGARWAPDEALKFMPNGVLEDVSLLMLQPNRDLG